MSRHRTHILVALFVALSLTTDASPADDSMARYFNALRERGLFRLAENYCFDRLKSTRLSPAERAEWTIELARTLAEHARNAAADEQEQFWQRADALLVELLESQPQNPRRMQIEAQSGLVRTARSEFLVAQAEAVPDDSAAKAAARTATEQAVTRLRSVEKTLAALALKLRANPTVAEGELSPNDVRSLLETLRFALANTLLDQARLAPRASPDRAAAVIDAEEIFKRQAGGLPGETLTWNARVLVAECARLKGEANRVETILAAVEKENPPAAVVERIAAIRARTALDAGKPDQAVLAVTQHFSRAKSLSGELAYLKAVSIAALAELAQAKSAELADELRKELETQVAATERDFAGWWGWRSRLVLEGSQQSREYGPEVAPLVRKAQAAWAGGRRDEAIDAFGAAAGLAAKSGKEAVAVEMGFTRASLLLQSDRIDDAGREFLSIADRFPQSEKAADSHLMWAYALGRLYEAKQTKERREAYAEALDAHRERFAEGPTAHEALWMQAALQERRLQYTQAYKLYREIPAGHRRGPEAQVAVARVLEAILARLREIKQPATEWEKAVYERLEATRATFPAEPAPLSRDQAEAAIRYARLCLALGRPDYVRADALLARVLKTPVPDEDAARNGPANDGVAGVERSEPPADRANDPQALVLDAETRKAIADSFRGLHRTATQLRIVSLAGQRRWTQAEQLANEFADSDPAEVLAVLKGLTQVGVAFDEETKRGLGELQFKAADRLLRRRETLPKEQQRQLDERVAEALVAIGQPARAATAYGALVKASPKDTPLRRTYAGVLMTSGTREHLAKAKAEWQAIESAEKPGETAWLEARLEAARCASLLGDPAESRKLIAQARVASPELGRPELAAKFRELELSLQK